MQFSRLHFRLKRTVRIKFMYLFFTKKRYPHGRQAAPENHTEPLLLKSQARGLSICILIQDSCVCDPNSRGLAFFFESLDTVTILLLRSIYSNGKHYMWISKVVRYHKSVLSLISAESRHFKPDVTKWYWNRVKYRRIKILHSFFFGKIVIL